MTDMITVTVKHALAHRKDAYTFQIPSTVTYTGQRVESPKWSPNSLCITTGDPSFPVRMIDAERVISINGVIAPPIKNTSAVFSIKGSGNNRYTVTVNGDAIECNCMGFQYRRQCKHVNTVKSRAA